MKFPNILYIEDDPDTRFLQARLWRKFEGHVEVASPEQWDVLRGGFEWVLLDFHLGVETALDWIPRVRARFPEAQIALLSNLDLQHPNVRQIKALGLPSFSKPMPLEALIEWTSTTVANNG